MNTTVAMELINSGEIDDFYIDRFSLSWDAESYGYDLSLCVSGPDNHSKRYTFLFASVVDVAAPSLGKGRTQVGSPRMEVHHDGWDGPRFDMFDVEGDGLSFSFKNIRLLNKNS
ncbi:hypothetical protein SAMN04488117_11867 [Celeribacter baekdonensis]|jgi:hypothetical protein|uniref:Uncharacterized protein n=1 Tax=Celeribacter baekdonensis TaxID=875171 RepID=A0A1G7TU96_9RHOB|nr:hypothetical protein [Celeribacter baekdonensis]SDG38594.1 hypothetical protein SAMN04488117_11867 [Celeribacter baekdonensis]